MAARTFSQEEIARFWSKVDKNGPIIRARLGRCWNWKTRKPGTYGQFGPRSRTVGAHRFAFFLQHGRWPRIAMHLCDNPSCVRHVVDGTVKENRRDAARKGRLPRGTSHFRTTIGENQVRKMRTLRKQGFSLRSLSKRFKIAIPTVSQICNRRTWKHI